MAALHIVNSVLRPEVLEATCHDFPAELRCARETAKWSEGVVVDGSQERPSPIRTDLTAQNIKPCSVRKRILQSNSNDSHNPQGRKLRTVLTVVIHMTRTIHEKESQRSHDVLVKKKPLKREKRV
jgi:hypothetical protein